MALRRFLTLRRLPSGPRVARPEYRLRGCPLPELQGRKRGDQALLCPVRCCAPVLVLGLWL